MKKLWVVFAALVAATLGAGAQSLLPACTNFNSCSLFGTSGNGTFQVTAIPPGATTINVQIQVATGAVSAPFTAQIQTASSLTGGTTLTSPTSCGSSATVGTAAGTYTLTCTASSSQPWAYVGVNFTSGTGATSGDLLAFSSSLLGSTAGLLIRANVFTAFQSFTDGTQGLVCGGYTGGGGFGACYVYGTTPGGNNYVYAASTSSTIVNSATTVDLDVGGNTGCALSLGVFDCSSATGAGLKPKQVTVASLPAASSSAGMTMVVTDSTAISAEGQTCAGSSTNKALAFSNGSAWKCF